MQRVVVTGLGIIAPGGNSLEAAWSSVVSGRPAVSTVTQFDASNLPVRIGAEVQQFDAAELMGVKDARKTSRFVQFASTAAQQAICDSGLDCSSATDRFGCVFGVGLGAVSEYEAQSQVLLERGPRKVSPLLIPMAIPSMAAGFVSIQHRLRGVNMGVATACASGNHAIGEAYLHIATGSADAIVAGASDSAFTPLVFAAFARMGALSTCNEAPETASRPFDLNRDGFVIGEGAAALVLENHEHAMRRGARIYAELVGYGASSDAYHITTPAPEGQGAARAMSAALKSAKLKPEDIDYVNAHGSSTTANDSAESAAIETVFAGHARKLSVSSTKGVTGHCLGAAGAVEAVFTIMAIHDGIVPPTANYSSPDPSCRLDYVPNSARQQKVRCALSNSFGFGGQNACLVFREFDSRGARFL